MIEVVILYLPILVAFAFLFLWWKTNRMNKEADRVFKELIEQLDKTQKLWEEYLLGIPKEDDDKR